MKNTTSNATPATMARRTPDQLGLKNAISVKLNKAKAITNLMANAVKGSDFEPGDEVLWAQQVIDDLISDAMRDVEQLTETA